MSIAADTPLAKLTPDPGAKNDPVGSGLKNFTSPCRTPQAFRALSWPGSWSSHTFVSNSSFSCRRLKGFRFRMQDLIRPKLPTTIPVYKKFVYFAVLRELSRIVQALLQVLVGRQGPALRMIMIVIISIINSFHKI